MKVSPGDQRDRGGECQILSRRRVTQHTCLLLLFLAALLIPSQSQGAPGRVVEFDIESQKLVNALIKFSDQADLVFVAPQALLKNKRSHAVKGNMEPSEALSRLLRGTGLAGEIDEHGTLIIRPAMPAETPGGEEAMSDKTRKKSILSSVFSSFTAVLAGVATLGLVNADTAAAQTGTKVLEEVVVTAQKREQSLQDVGIAITALNENRLVDAQVNTIADLQNMAAGLTLGESFGFAQIMIRGVGTDNPFAGGDPSVALHVDGVVTGQSSAQLGSLFDIQRIEVLRGPQGTLYGRNTTGGSINVITNKPTDKFSGYGRFTAGNYTLLQFEGAVGGPLTDQLQARLATKIVERDGYGDNLATSGDVNDASRQSVRGQLRWLPTPDMDVLISMEYHREDDKNYMPLYRDGSYLPNPPVPALLPQPQGVPRASNPRDIYADTPLQNKREQYSLTGTFNWQFANALKFVSITNYQTFEKIPQQDFDMTAVPFYTQSEQIDTSQFSQELRLHYDSDHINGLIGLYYYYDEIKSDNRLYQAIPVPPCGPVTDDVLHYPITDLCFHFRGATNTDAAAIFMNIDFAFTDNVTITFGGRYSYEMRKGFTDRWIAPGLLTPLTFADKGSFNDFTPRVGFEWHILPDIMFYTNYSEGFKSGILLSGQRTPLLKPETVVAYEMGLKSQFLDRRLLLNVAGFYYDYNDLQLGRSVPAGATGFTLVYENAAQAEVKGVELETAWLITDQFSLNGSLTYLNAKFTNYVTTDPFDTVFFQLGLAGPPPDKQLRGNRLVQAPKWAWTLRGVYDFELPYTGWTGQAALEAAYKSRVFFTQFNYDALGQGGVTTFNANVKFTNGPWSLNLWGKNLTDKDIYTGTFIINGSRTNAGMLKAPRTFGATLGYSF